MYNLNRMINLKMMKLSQSSLSLSSSPQRDVFLNLSHDCTGALTSITGDPITAESESVNGTQDVLMMQLDVIALVADLDPYSMLTFFTVSVIFPVPH